MRRNPFRHRVRRYGRSQQGPIVARRFKSKDQAIENKDRIINGMAICQDTPAAGIVKFIDNRTVFCQQNSEPSA
jgi:hypothetical protein